MSALALRQQVIIFLHSQAIYFFQAAYALHVVTARCCLYLCSASRYLSNCFTLERTVWDSEVTHKLQDHDLKRRPRFPSSGIIRLVLVSVQSRAVMQ